MNICKAALRMVSASRRRPFALLPCSLALAASAQQSPPPVEPPTPAASKSTTNKVDSVQTIPNVIVTARSSDVGQSTIDPRLGIRVYTIDTAQIQNMPQGADTPFAEVVERSPGVSQDAYGSWHVRG